MTSTRTIVVALAALAFLGGRALHERRGGEGSASVAGPATARDHAPPLGGAHARPSPFADGAALAVLAKALSAPSSPAALEAMNTMTESPADTATRHRHVEEEIDQKYPLLDRPKRELLVAVNDRIEANRRQWRAAFMVDAVSEDEYVAALKDGVRANFEELGKSLSLDEFHHLVGWEPNVDPFEPTGVWIDPALARDKRVAGSDGASPER